MPQSHRPNTSFNNYTNECVKKHRESLRQINRNCGIQTETSTCQQEVSGKPIMKTASNDPMNFDKMAAYASRITCPVRQKFYMSDEHERPKQKKIYNVSSSLYNPNRALLNTIRRAEGDLAQFRLRSPNRPPISRKSPPNRNRKANTRVGISTSDRRQLTVSKRTLNSQDSQCGQCEPTSAVEMYPGDANSSDRIVKPSAANKWGRLGSSDVLHMDIKPRIYVDSAVPRGGRFELLNAVPPPNCARQSLKRKLQINSFNTNNQKQFSCHGLDSRRNEYKVRKVRSIDSVGSKCHDDKTHSIRSAQTMSSIDKAGPFRRNFTTPLKVLINKIDFEQSQHDKVRVKGKINVPARYRMCKGRRCCCVEQN